MNKTIEDLKCKSRNEIDKLQSEIIEIRDQAKMKEDDMEQIIKEREEEIKSMRNKFEKEMAIYLQKIEFKDV